MSGGPGAGGIAARCRKTYLDWSLLFVCRVNVTVGSLVSVLTSPEPTRGAVIPPPLSSRCLHAATQPQQVSASVCVMFCLYLLRSLCF